MLIYPKNYHSLLSLYDTQAGIKLIKDEFERNLAKQLRLYRVSAPLFVDEKSGLNDNLNGVERPVSFQIKNIEGNYEIVHSLAKWKRMALKKYDFYEHKGLYTDMNAIRRDEDLDNLHSIYVDQWDWEKIITEDERNMDYLKACVTDIVKALKETETTLVYRYPVLVPFIEETVSFITSQELLDLYPDKTAKEREYLYTKEHKTVFISQIGDILSNGEKHDGRAPDYDDWALNGDILVYDPLLDCAMEISSMGIRVNKESLLSQLEKAGCMDRLALPFHQSLLHDELPLTMGGGIGQGRLCMLLLQKAHIGEVQVSAWGKEMREECARHNIDLL